MSGIVGSRFNMRGSGLVGSLGTDGQVFTSSGAGAGAVFEAGGGGTNTPAFSAYLSDSHQATSHATVTKVALDTENYDTDSTFDSSTNYRFTVPSGEGGKYLITASLFIEGSGTSKANGVHAYLYKNGSEVMRSGCDYRANPGTNVTPSFATNMILVATDYLELYGRWDSPDSSAATIYGFYIYSTHFSALKLIE
jgi:hypothetical protein